MLLTIPILRVMEVVRLEFSLPPKPVNILQLYFQANNNPFTAMQGTTLKSLKHHTALQPLFIIMGAGIVFVALYCGR